MPYSQIIESRILVEYALGETVDPLVLTLYCAKSEDERARTVSFERVTGSWTENGVTWKCEACWERSEQYNMPSSFWGGSAISVDIYRTDPGYYTVSLTSLVQNWVDGTWTNPSHFTCGTIAGGVMARMVLDEAVYDEAYCVSSDVEIASQRPKLEVDWHAQEDPIYRSYYYLGGQRIALRVQEGEEDDVYWLHTDHLGSTSLLSTITGTQVSGSTTRFLPFGDYRTEPESDLTDKGYTGHAHNDPLGLVYMRARYYVASVGRFSQADTIVPDPSNPQSHNRYSYVNNRPLVAVDPSGHHVEKPSDGEAPPPPLPLPPVCDESSWCLPMQGPIGITIVYVPGEPGIDVSQIRARTGRTLSQIGLGIDVIELGMSTVGVLGEPVVSAAGAIGGPGGVALAWLLERIGTDGPETVVGNLNLVVSIVADFEGGYTYVDYDTFELVIGQATLLNIVEQGVDWAMPASPDVDLVSNTAVLGYDAGSLAGLVPNCLEYRVPLLPPITWSPFTGGYFVLYLPVQGAAVNH